MPRTRNVRPDFFIDEKKIGLSALARLLLLGLPCHADKAGRLEDRPMRLKVQLLPWDKVDVNDLLDELASGGHVIRYEADGMKFLQITDYQHHPAGSETESVIIPPPRNLSQQVPPKAQQGSHDLVACSLELVKERDLARAEKPARPPRTFFRTGEEALEHAAVIDLIQHRDPYGQPDRAFWPSLFDTFRQAKQTRDQVLTLRELETFFSRIAKVGHEALYRGARVYQEKHPHKPMAYCIGIMTGESRNPSKPKANGAAVEPEKPRKPTDPFKDLEKCEIPGGCGYAYKRGTEHRCEA